MGGSLPVVCLEALHVRAALRVQRNKADAADALGIAHFVRTGWYKSAHIKSEACYRLRLLRTHRRNLKRKFLDLENAIRHSLKAFGLRLHKVVPRGVRSGRTRRGGRRRAHRRSHEQHARRARGAVERVPASAPVGVGTGGAGRAVPALHWASPARGR